MKATALTTLDGLDRELIEARFWRLVDRTPEGTTCWLWRGSVNWKGYGKFMLVGHWRQAHRVAYVLQHGQVASDLHVDHLCRVRNCVNPTHLEAVTCSENLLRGAAARPSKPRAVPKPRPRMVPVFPRLRVACHVGHPMVGYNVVVTNWARGLATCRRCRQLVDQRRGQRRVGDRHASRLAPHPPIKVLPGASHGAGVGGAA